MTNNVIICLACRIERVDRRRSCMCGNDSVLFGLCKLLAVIGFINHTNGNTKANRAKLARPVPNVHIRAEGRPGWIFQCDDSAEDIMPTESKIVHPTLFQMPYPTCKRETTIDPNRSGGWVHTSELAWILWNLTRKNNSWHHIMSRLIQQPVFEGTYESIQHRKANSSPQPTIGIFFKLYETTTDVKAMTIL